MQFRITLRLKQPGQLLPLSYQYELSAWIYHLLEQANSDFAKFLHEEGYLAGKKRFKLFVFSNLHIPHGGYTILDDRMKIHAREISFVISFLVPQAAQDLLMGLFKEQRFRLGDRITGIDFQVHTIECLPLPHFSERVIRFKCTAPLVVSQPKISSKGKLISDYLAPSDPTYSQYFWGNLRDKHKAALAVQLATPIPKSPEYSFRCLTERPKARLIRIKAHTPAETKVKGYLFDFELEAPQELLRLGLLAGFGVENALGFGAVRVIK